MEAFIAPLKSPKILEFFPWKHAAKALKSFIFDGFKALK
jgi:hypothetical protein